MQQKIVIGLILTLIIVIFIPYYWLTEPARQQAARGRIENEAVIRGSEIYVSNCASCHGASGNGGLGPALQNSPLDEATMAKIISRGMPGTLMPAMSSTEGGPLSKNQINDLVTFIKNLRTTMTKALATNAPPTTALTTPVITPATSPAPQTAAANAAELYSAKCELCHGTKREGISGLAPPLTPTSLAARSLAEVQATITAGRLAKGMPPFGSILSPDEINTLTTFIKNTSP